MNSLTIPFLKLARVKLCAVLILLLPLPLAAQSPALLDEEFNYEHKCSASSAALHHTHLQSFPDFLRQKQSPSLSASAPRGGALADSGRASRGERGVVSARARARVEVSRPFRVAERWRAFTGGLSCIATRNQVVTAFFASRLRESSRRKSPQGRHPRRRRRHTRSRRRRAPSLDQLCQITASRTARSNLFERPCSIAAG